MPQRIAELLQRYAACITAGDKAGIVALYASDASAEIPAGGPVHRGIDAIRRFYFENELAKSVEITGPVCVAGREAAVPMRAIVARDGGLVEVDVIDVVEVDASGRFTRLRALFDLEGARRVGPAPAPGGGARRMRRLEFHYDVGSPWTYLAFSRIEAIARDHGAELHFRPILVGGVFNAVNEDVYRMRANPNRIKARYHAKDLEDWARLYELRIRWPSVFPVNSVKAMRGALAAEERERLVEWSRACFEAYWGDGEDLSQDSVLERVALRVGIDPPWLFARIAAPEIKQKLRANTEELVARGGFGSPTVFVNQTDMFFGNDRLPLVEAALARS